MLLLLRAVLLLGLVALLHADRNGKIVSVKLGQGIRRRSKTVRLKLDASVHPQTFHSPIASMSVTPWTYRDSLMESRVPQRISHAQCLTSGCLSLHGEGEDSVLQAKPIQYQTLVLHRVPRRRRNMRKGSKAKRKYDFRLGTEVITVGCTCVRPSVLSQ
ncbi:interleukin 17a/f3 [Solea solea]|uniref:interleukin 17a/f3 n=1 Tax=Solea solea TaxID=90069 RepID=UPI00272C4933|nr:interleukin 17a/f3 [Solea solea]